jgi:hypothetical protein
LGAVPNPRNKSVVTRENSLRNRIVTRTGMGFELGADGNGAGARAGGGGSAGNNVATQSAYGATPTLGTPNAFGAIAGQASSPQSNDPPFKQPDAFMAEVDAKAGNTYARLFADTKDHYTRLGALPPSDEPKVLTDPANIGHLPVDEIEFPGVDVPPNATLTTSQVAEKKAQAKTSRANMKAVEAPENKTKTGTNEEPLFKSSSGIYTTTSGDFYANIGRSTGINGGGDIVLQSVGDTTLNAKNLYTAAQKDVQHIAGGKLEIYAVGDIIIRAGGKIEISSNKTMSQNSGETDTETSFADTNAINFGNLTETNYGTSTTTNYGAQTETNHGKSTIVTNGDTDETIRGKTTTTVYGNSTTTTFGQNYEFNSTGYFTASLAGGMEVYCGLKLDVMSASKIDVFLGLFSVDLHAEAVALEAYYSRAKVETSMGAKIEKHVGVVCTVDGNLSVEKSAASIRLGVIRHYL